ncbi:MAG: UDP-N-acetylmuramate dehydrogenase [Proteobacteria bacterium]|nr:UDP-N-acetylmuramate dehydrogenase [Pseudomonadota bacterium]
MKTEIIDPFVRDIRNQTWIEKIKLEEPLSNKTSVRVGGPASYFQRVHSLIELRSLIEIIKDHCLPWFLIGKGTNLLVPDDGFKGIIIQLDGEFNSISKTSGSEITCGAGLSNKKFSRFARDQGLAGSEFLLTIPGSIGGALFMNAGAHGDQISDITSWVKAIDNDGELLRLDKESSLFAYRHSIFMEKKLIVISAGLQLIPGTIEAITRKEKELISQRKKTQPINLKTWGSVFMNPVDDSAGRLIEACGLKGKGIGQARISTKHANFIENKGGASFQDLMDTISMARDNVRKRFGIDLKTEGQILSEY